MQPSVAMLMASDLHEFLMNSMLICVDSMLICYFNCRIPVLKYGSRRLHCPEGAPALGNTHEHRATKWRHKQQQTPSRLRLRHRHI